MRAVSARRRKSRRDSDSGLNARLECDVGLPFPAELLNGALVLAVWRFQPPLSEQDTVSGATVVTAEGDDDEFDLDAADEARFEAEEVARAAAVERSCALLDVLLARSRDLPLDPNFKSANTICGDDKALSCLQVAASQHIPGTAFEGSEPSSWGKESLCLAARAHRAMIDRLLALKASVDDPVRLDRSDNNLTFPRNTEEGVLHNHEGEFAAPKERGHEEEHQFKDTSSSSSSSRTGKERTEIFEGDTPLMLAIRAGNDYLAKALIDLHASIVSCGLHPWSSRYA